MPNTLIKIFLFLSSYFPLAVIFLIIYYNTQLYIGLFSFFIGLIGFLGLLIFLKKLKKITPISYIVDSINKKDNESISYIVTYIIPFLSIPLTGWQPIVAIIIFLFIVGTLYVNSDMIHINPVLNLLGFHLYEITSQNNTYFILSKIKIRKNEIIKAITISDDILMVKYIDKN
jgi:hypothetical protein